MANKKKSADRGFLAKLAGGGPNQRGSKRGSTRPGGEGRGLIRSVRALFGRGK